MHHLWNIKCRCTVSSARVVFSLKSPVKEHVYAWFYVRVFLDTTNKDIDQESKWEE